MAFYRKRRRSFRRKRYTLGRRRSFRRIRRLMRRKRFSRRLRRRRGLMKIGWRL